MNFRLFRYYYIDLKIYNKKVNLSQNIIIESKYNYLYHLNTNLIRFEINLLHSKPFNLIV